jgi:hypothetical protein
MSDSAIWHHSRNALGQGSVKGVACPRHREHDCIWSTVASMYIIPQIYAKLFRRNGVSDAR